MTVIEWEIVCRCCRRPARHRQRGLLDFFTWKVVVSSAVMRQIGSCHISGRTTKKPRVTMNGPAALTDCQVSAPREARENNRCYMIYDALHIVLLHRYLDAYRELRRCCSTVHRWRNNNYRHLRDMGFHQTEACVIDFVLSVSRSVGLTT